MPMSPRLLRPRATGFDPRRIPDLALWLDASVSSGYSATSGQVTQWNDLSGNARHFTQTTANNRPTLFVSSSDTQGSTQSLINGKQSFFFDGVNDRLAGNTAARNIGRNAPGLTMFVVCRYESGVNGDKTVYAMLTSGNDFRHGIQGRQGANQHMLLGKRLDADSLVTRFSAAGGLVFGQSMLKVAVFDHAAATSRLTVNGASMIEQGAHGTSGQTSDTAGGQVNIGFTGFGSFFLGHLGAILAYNRALSAPEIQAASRWLASYWGVVA